MPNEYDFIKGRTEREMPDDKFKKQREEYNRKADESNDKIKKLVFIFLGFFAVSFAIINIIALANSSSNYGAGVGNYTWLAAEFIFLALFLYDPKAEEEKRYKYETDKNIILTSLKNKIKLNNIRFGFVIGLGIIFIILNIAAWWIIGVNLSNLGS